jgi:hypothetical protein
MPIQPLSTIDAIVQSVHRALAPQYEAQLRAQLADRDRDWLIDQVVRLSLDAAAVEQLDRQATIATKAAARAARRERVQRMAVDTTVVRRFRDEHAATTRESLMVEGALMFGAPVKGTAMVAAEHRSTAGEALLTLAKDMLYALLFGTEATNTRLDRVQQELLTFALPRAKAGALDFMQASTEVVAAGTWQDPDSVSNDERADNVVLEVQYGETAGEDVGTAIVTALSLINNLEVNEQVLYARMVNVEESSLIV